MQAALRRPKQHASGNLMKLISSRKNTGLAGHRPYIVLQLPPLEAPGLLKSTCQIQGKVASNNIQFHHSSDVTMQLQQVQMTVAHR